MTIRGLLLTGIKTDFYTSPDSDTLKIPSDSGFWLWFRDNSERIPLGSKEITIEDHELYKSGNCMGNSQNYAICQELDYYEGFVETHNGLSLHGFTVSAGNVVDVTVLCNKSNFRDLNGNLPNNYYGIQIPLDFVKGNTPDDIESNFINLPPLIYDYYLKTRNQNDR